MAAHRSDARIRWPFVTVTTVTVGQGVSSPTERQLLIICRFIRLTPFEGRRGWPLAIPSPFRRWMRA